MRPRRPKRAPRAFQYGQKSSRDFSHSLYRATKGFKNFFARPSERPHFKKKLPRVRGLPEAFLRIPLQRRHTPRTVRGPSFVPPALRHSHLHMGGSFVKALASEFPSPAHFPSLPSFDGWTA
eukprot:8874952-Pyramimonas_sp.AAC.1